MTSTLAAIFNHLLAMMEARTDADLLILKSTRYLQYDLNLAFQRSIKIQWTLS